MVRIFRYIFILSLLISACSLNPPVVSLPTPAATTLPILPPTQTSSPSPIPSFTVAPTATLTPTSRPSSTPTPPPTFTPTPPAPAGSLYLSQRLGDGRLASIPAPEIPGLTMRLGADGSTIEYVDPQGKTLLLADARQLNRDKNDDDRLIEVLDTLYGIEGVYARASTYPRFRFPAEGVEASFFGLDRALTYWQILRLKEALDLFTRSDFSALRSAIFDEKNSYVFMETLGQDHLGENFAGSRVALLDRQSLFGNTYLLAMVIAHEGSHILQGGIGPQFTCQDLLRREIGDHKIPNNFSNWSAEQVVQGIQNGQLGAYHVSYWVLAKLGLGSLEGLKAVIYNGSVNSQDLISCDQN